MQNVDIRRRILEVIRRLRMDYPVPATALNFSNHFELLVATILSAQTTDMQVNKVTESLFKKYKSIMDYANASVDVIQKDISSINFYKNKGKNIQACAKIILENFNSKVPKTMNELTSLPGVARKTANVVLSNAYGINSGIAVDTHVKRLAHRLGLTKNKDPVKIEKDLMAITPKEEWSNLSHFLIFYGRKICQARKPMHDECVLYDICPSNDI